MKHTPPEPAGVGEVRLVRSFRVGRDGGLYAVHGPQRWADGWNRATCRKGRRHDVPAEGCSCGFYGYAHPAFTRREPTSRQVLAVVATHGAMEVGTRGARVGQARVVGIWLGRRVSDALAELVRREYPSVLIYRDQAAMLTDLPLTRLDAFHPPRLGARWRWFGYLALALLIVAAALVGGLSSSPNQEGGPVWIAVILTALLVAVVAVFRRAQMITLAAMTAVAWMVTGTSTSPLAGTYRGAVVLVIVWVLGSWWWTGRVGADPAESTLEALIRRLRRGWS